jgi:hypothetical protein
VAPGGIFGEVNPVGLAIVTKPWLWLVVAASCVVRAVAGAPHAAASSERPRKKVRIAFFFTDERILHRLE